MSAQSSKHPFRNRVLAADDNPSTRRLISFKLQREGFNVETVENGEQLVSRMAEFRPGLVILDLMMPIMDGYSALKALKSNRDTSSIPILMLSSKNHEDDILRCLNAGAADFMIKPFSPDELVVRVRKLLSRDSRPPVR